MKKSLLLNCLLIYSILTVSAESFDALILHMTSGKQVTYMLDELPVVSFKGEELIITTQMNAVSYQAGDVVKFTYSNIDPAKVYETKMYNTMFKLEGNVLHAYNLEPFSKVFIYDMAGALITSADTGAKGEVNLSLPQSSGSVFVVKTSIANFKLMKL